MPDKKCIIESFVYDFDSRSPFGCKFEDYYAASFDKVDLTNICAPQFRIVVADTMINSFASDRSHMKS